MTAEPENSAAGDAARSRPAAAASGRSLAPALWATTTWESDGLADANRRATGTRVGEFYSRYANPTVRSFEEAVAASRVPRTRSPSPPGWARCRASSSPSARPAITSSRSGSCTPGTLAFLQGPCQRFGIETTLVDGREPGAFAAAVRPGKTMLVLAETPSNPRLDLVDLDELGAIKGPITVVDSTLATPLGQRPLAHGVDLSLHSATKGIAGHNDATLGVIAGEAELVDAIWAYAVLHGATPSPFDALNALRGIRTLVGAHHAPVRLGAAPRRVDRRPSGRRREHLSRQPELRAVRPREATDGVRRHGAGDRAARRTSPLRSRFLAGAEAGTRRHVARRPRDARVPPRHVDARQPVAARRRRSAGVTDGLLRISVGLEDPADLLADVAQALAGTC